MAEVKKEKPTVENVIPEPKKVTFGGAAEAALAERWRKEGSEVLVYVFRGEEYRVSPRHTASTVLALADAEANDNMAAILDIIRGTFVGEDGERMVAAIKDTSTDAPADVDFLLEMIREIDEYLVNRPPTN